MTKHGVAIAIMGGICAVTLAVTTPARGQSVAVFLSQAGGGTSCTLNAPCASIGFAITAAAANGATEVICLNKGNYGPPAGTGIVISAPITISCGDGLWEAAGGFVSVSGQAGSDIVIEGLVMDRTGFTFTGQGALQLRRVRFGNQPGSGNHGLLFQPTGPATLHIADSYFYNNGGSGVLIKPASSGSANVHIGNSRFEHNLHGLFVDGTASSAGVNVNMVESAAVDNKGNGIGGYTGSAPVTVSVTTSQVTGNLTNGIGVLGVGPAPVAVKIGNSQITGNVNGINAGGSGQIVTLGGNQLHSNLSDGNFTGSIATK